MKIVLTSDTHFPINPDLVNDGDVLIHAGDLMYSGQADEWYPRLEALKALPHKIKILVPGNHDFHIRNYEGSAAAELRAAGIKLLGASRSSTVVEGVKILGLPWVTNLPGWAFNVTEDKLATRLDDLGEVATSADIIVSHCPPYKILDACNPDERRFKDQRHVGAKAYTTWLSNGVPKAVKHWVVGHIHESYGRTNVHGVEFYNVAMCDGDYKQVNSSMVIEL